MRIVLTFLILLVSFCNTFSQDYVIKVDKVQQYFVKEREQLLARSNSSDCFEVFNRLLDIGEWSLVSESLNDNKCLSSLQKSLLQVKYYWLNNDFDKCQAILNGLDTKSQQTLLVQRWKAVLEIEAWRLEEAELAAQSLLKQYPNDIETSMVLGRSLLLQKKYNKALELSNHLIEQYPNDASGYYLKAEVYFWDQKPKEAEEYLVKSLQLNPLNADARFYYGYAIWRRIDATQLNDMMAQWDLALQFNPLHFQTHWHIGNGHTNLTFADYVDKDEKAIRATLESADTYFTNNNSKAAFDVISSTKKEFKSSVLPDMHKASLLYGDFDALDRKANLDEAELIFLDILSKKKHYGPAHNGLSAVIKSKRIPFLKTYSSIMESLRNPKIDNIDDFLEIFPDVAYYPGNVAKGMAWNQLYSSVVYFPFLVKQHRLFVIPPLHNDLAIAMKAPYFRFNTTFDNRQWMDIRGVGSGAAAIEYVERGAFEERNVLLHEYVHLFHGQVLTDEQNRKIKALYYNAMEKGLTLDYYSQNNESEYLAQTYPAYFERVKVHPLDFKSMNTLSDLSSKDPEMYAFLDEMISKEKAYLAGDQKAMASNWAQVYLNLANNALKASLEESYKFLDTALLYDPNYLPAHLAIAKNNITQGKYKIAHDRLQTAKHINVNYAPIYVAEAELLVASKPKDYASQAALFKKAYEMENDYMIKAQSSFLLRDFYYQRGLLSEALSIADEYIQNGSEISTYLRDRKTDAKAFVAWQKALYGNAESVKDLAYLVSQKPFNHSLRIQYIEALITTKDFKEALTNLDEVYRNLQASQINRPEFELLYTILYTALDDKESYNNMMNKFFVDGFEAGRLNSLSNLKLADVLLLNGDLAKAKEVFSKIEDNSSLLFLANKNLLNAKILLNQGKEKEVLISLEKAIELNPYNPDYSFLLSQFSINPKKVEQLKQRIKNI